MKRRFGLIYAPVTIVLAAFYCQLYRTSISDQTGFYSGPDFLLTLFYLLCGVGLIFLYIWSRKAARVPRQSATGDSRFWGASGVICGIIILADAIAQGYTAVLPLIRDGYGFRTYLLPVGQFLLAAGAGGTLLLLGIRLFTRNLAPYRYSASLLILVAWRTVHLFARFSQLPIAFRMPQRLLEILLLVCQCWFILEGCHLLCNVVGKQDCSMALFSGYASVAIGLMWLLSPLLAGKAAFPQGIQWLTYFAQWAILLFIAFFVAFLTPCDGVQGKQVGTDE